MMMNLMMNLIMMGRKKKRRSFGFEVGSCIFASVFQSSSVVGSGCLLLLVEGPEPDPLVLVVDLGSPSAIGLGNNSLEVR
jgi:hypothetical protein